MIPICRCPANQLSESMMIVIDVRKELSSGPCTWSTGSPSACPGCPALGSADRSSAFHWAACAAGPHLSRHSDMNSGQKKEATHSMGKSPSSAEADQREVRSCSSHSAHLCMHEGKDPNDGYALVVTSLSITSTSISPTISSLVVIIPSVSSAIITVQTDRT